MVKHHTQYVRLLKWNSRCIVHYNSSLMNYSALMETQSFCLSVLQASIKAAVIESTISLMTMTTTQTALNTCCVSAPACPLCLALLKLSFIFKGRAGSWPNFCHMIWSPEQSPTREYCFIQRLIKKPNKCIKCAVNCDRKQKNRF